jgi:hypothetical protein
LPRGNDTPVLMRRAPPRLVSRRGLGGGDLARRHSDHIGHHIRHHIRHVVPTVHCASWRRTATVSSDWVKAEAGRAKADGKLIPVKTPEVGYADIPLPFGEMHTENVGSTALIRAAIVAQLAKPVVEPSAWASLRKGFKWELLSWVGIVGGALTLFTNLREVLKLADWARLVVQHWREWTHGFWVWMFGWLGIHLTPEWTQVLSFLLFWSLLTFGEAVKYDRTVNYDTFKLVPNFRKHLVFRTNFFTSGQIRFTAGEIIRYITAFLFLSSAFIDKKDQKTGMFLGAVVLLTVLLTPMGLLVLFARDRLNAAITLFLLVVFWYVIIGGLDNVSAAAVSMIYFLPMILLVVAPTKAVSRRLIFLGLGLLLLIALNELSKLGLDLTAPQG